MTARSYGKVYARITKSTIWSEPYSTRVVWITMLAECDRQGRWLGSIHGLARSANVQLDEARAAIERFQRPDPDSTSPEYEGRRVDVIEGGWLILNHRKYRDMRDDEARLEYQREWDREHRASRSARKSLNPEQQGASDTSDMFRQTPTPTATATDTAKDTPLTPQRGNGKHDAPTLFDRFWTAYPRRVGKIAAQRAWLKLKPDEHLVDLMLNAIAVQSASSQWQRDGGQFIPHPATWLNGRRWDDDASAHQPSPAGVPHGSARPQAARRASLAEESERMLRQAAELDERDRQRESEPH